jgi:polar amino acid transport system substrate-binding protein
MTIKRQPKHFFTSTIIFISAIFFASNYCVAKSTLHLVTEENPPYQYIDEKGEAKGCAIDMLKAMAEITKDELDINFLPWARAYAIAESKPNTMIFSMARNTFREHNFYWIGSINLQHNVFWGLKSKYPSGKISETQLINAAIVLGNTSTADHILTEKNKFNLYRVSNISQGIYMLMSKRADLLVSPESVLKRRFKKIGESFEEVVPVYSMADLSYELSFAFGIKSNQGLVFKYTQAYQQLKQQKVIEKIASRCVTL